jgi:hypothetical protein
MAIPVALGCAVLAGCGAAAGTGAGTLTSRSASVAPGAPQVAVSPQVVTMPRTSAAGAGQPAHSPSGSPPASGPDSPGAPSASGSSDAPQTCSNPQFTTSAQFGMWNQSPYFVYNNMWGIQGYQVTQTLAACSYSDWHVVADMNNDSGNGAVKTYPNAQRDFSNAQITSLSSAPSTFAISGFPGGIYEYAYDIWINGLATSGSTEVMIWTYNHGQVPSGSVVAQVTMDGRGYQVWKNGNYIAFVADQNFTSASMDLLPFFTWIIAQGWLNDSAVLSQVCYGVELVSTDSTPETFSFSQFSVNAS